MRRRHDHLGDQEGYWVHPQKSYSLVLVLSAIFSVTLDKLLPLSGPQSPHLKQERLGQMLSKLQPYEPDEL